MGPVITLEPCVRIVHSIVVDFQADKCPLLPQWVHKDWVRAVRSVLKSAALVG